MLFTLPWPQLLFAGLSLAAAGLFAALARRSAFRALRWALGGLCVLWVLSALVNLYSAPAYNIRVDLVLAQVVLLPLTTVVEGLVVVALWVAARR